MEANTKGGSPIRHDMLWGRRQYFIDSVKKPFQFALIRSAIVVEGNRLLLRKANKFLRTIQLLWDVWLIVRSINRYPEPTRETAKKQITLVLFDLWDEFEKYNEVKQVLFRAVRKVTLCQCEHDVDYSQRMTWFLKRLTEKYNSGEWRPLEPWTPKYAWNDPAVREAWRKAMHEIALFGTIDGRPLVEVET